MNAEVRPPVLTDGVVEIRLACLMSFVVNYPTLLSPISLKVILLSFSDVVFPVHLINDDVNEHEGLLMETLIVDFSGCLL